MIRVTPVQGPENLRNSDTIIAEQHGGLFDVEQVASARETIFPVRWTNSGNSRKFLRDLDLAGLLQGRKCGVRLFAEGSQKTRSWMARALMSSFAFRTFCK